jgi:uncharacterized protein YciI
MKQSWNDYLAVARARGARAFEVFAIQSDIAEPAKIEEARADHLAFIGDLEAKGRLLFAGPLSDAAGELIAGGLIVVRAASFAEACEIAGADPMHKSGARRFAVRRWMINEGCLNFSVRLSRDGAVLS